LSLKKLVNRIKAQVPIGIPAASLFNYRQGGYGKLVLTNLNPVTPRSQTMSSIQTSPENNQKYDDIPSDILELTQAIEQLPLEHRIRLMPSLRRVTESSVRRRRILTLVQEALGQLRLDMKYLVFDLEATRRERDEMVQKLNDLGCDE
jgi:hypothetical protein